MRFSPSKLKALRLGAGYSREDLGREVDRSYASIESYEGCRAVPSLQTFLALATALKVDRLEELVEP